MKTTQLVKESILKNIPWSRVIYLFIYIFNFSILWYWKFGWVFPKKIAKLVKFTLTSTRHISLKCLQIFWVEKKVEIWINKKNENKIEILPNVMRKETADSSSYNVCADSRSHWQQPKKESSSILESSVKGAVRSFSKRLLGSAEAIRPDPTRPDPSRPVSSCPQSHLVSP
jgi:hypothetical protein